MDRGPQTFRVFFQWLLHPDQDVLFEATLVRLFALTHSLSFNTCFLGNVCRWTRKRLGPYYIEQIMRDIRGGVWRNFLLNYHWLGDHLLLDDHLLDYQSLEMDDLAFNIQSFHTCASCGAPYKICELEEERRSFMQYHVDDDDDDDYGYSRHKTREYISRIESKIKGQSLLAKIPCTCRYSLGNTAVYSLVNCPLLYKSLCANYEWYWIGTTLHIETRHVGYSDGYELSSAEESACEYHRIHNT